MVQTTRLYPVEYCLERSQSCASAARGGGSTSTLQGERIMTHSSSRKLAALLGGAALAIAAVGSFTASADEVATVEIVNLSGADVSFVALLPEGQALKDDTPNLLKAVLAPRAGVLTSVAAGAYRLAGSAFTSGRVVLAAGDVVTLTLSEPQGKGVEVALKATAPGTAPAFAKKIGQQLPSKQ